MPISINDILLAIVQLIDTFFIWINGLVYDFINFLYQIFIALSSATIFTSDQYQAIADRVYILIGVVALFLIAYALLRAIINPENAAKGDYALGKIVPNLLKVVVLIAFTPTIFSFAYKMQELITANNVIPRIILGDNVGSGQNFYEEDRSYNGEGSFSYKEAGRTLANEVFRGFLYPATDDNGKTIGLDEISTTTCIFRKGKCESEGDAFTFKDAIKKVNKGDENFSVYANFAHLIHGEDKQLEYNGIFQLVAGIFVIYVFANYCLDLGLRAVKLGYLQLLAPIPILTILIPGQDKIFKNWLKQTVSTFADVFMRIAIIFFGLLLIQMLPSFGDLWPDSLFEVNTTVQNFARVFIIIGILMFIKQAPKLLSDITGLNTGSFKLGIADKLKDMAFVGDAASNAVSGLQGAATGALGAGWTARRNGGNLGDALKYGALSGFKGKGNQFNKQRVSMWQKAYGMNGDPSWIGGKDKFAAALDQVKNEANDRFMQYDPKKGLGTNSRRIREMENSEAFRAIKESNYNAINAAVDTLRIAEDKYDSVIDYYKKQNEQLSRDIAGKQLAMEGYTNDYNSRFDRAKNDYMTYLDSQRRTAEASGNSAQVAALTQQMDNVRNGSLNNEVMNYAKNNNSALYDAINSANSNRSNIQSEITSLNNTMRTNSAIVAQQMQDKADDKAISRAKEELGQYKFIDADGNEIKVNSASDISSDAIARATYNSSKAEFKKKNDEYAWRIAAEDAEKREADIKTKKGSVDYQIQKELFDSLAGKISSDKK